MCVRGVFFQHTPISGSAKADGHFPGTEQQGLNQTPTARLTILPGAIPSTQLLFRELNSKCLQLKDQKAVFAPQHPTYFFSGHRKLFVSCVSLLGLRRLLHQPDPVIEAVGHLGAREKGPAGFHESLGHVRFIASQELNLWGEIVLSHQNKHS